MSTAQVGGAEYEHERYRGVLNVRDKGNGDVDRLQAFANRANRAWTDADLARRGPRAVARDWTKASRNRLECPALMSITSNASVSAGQPRSRPSFNNAAPSSGDRARQSQVGAVLGIKSGGRSALGNRPAKNHRRLQPTLPPERVRQLLRCLQNVFLLTGRCCLQDQFSSTIPVSPALTPILHYHNELRGFSERFQPLQQSTPDLNRPSQLLTEIRFPRFRHPQIMRRVSSPRKPKFHKFWLKPACRSN